MPLWHAQEQRYLYFMWNLSLKMLIVTQCWVTMMDPWSIISVCWQHCKQILCTTSGIILRLDVTSCEVVPVHIMRACGGVGYSSTHSYPWHWTEVSGQLHALPLYPRGNSSWYSLNGELDEAPELVLMLWQREKSLALAGSWTMIP